MLTTDITCWDGSRKRVRCFGEYGPHLVVVQHVTNGKPVPRVYNISHVPTGLALPTSHTLSCARKLAAALAAGYDWNFKAPPRDLRENVAAAIKRDCSCPKLARRSGR